MMWGRNGQAQSSPVHHFSGLNGRSLWAPISGEEEGAFRLFLQMSPASGPMR
jgi:hypothetical protein